MYAYSKYNQIQMDPVDEDKMSFITNQGLYCYKVMSFGLKNARATYQRLVNNMFAEQLGKSIEVYMICSLNHSGQMNIFGILSRLFKS